MSEHAVFFSIITPTFNRAQKVDQAIASVCSQSFPDWEHIIIDDGSTDHTRQVVEHWSASDKRIRYLWQQNAERSAARNNGIANAKGKYILFLDSDDLFLPDHLRGLHAKLRDVAFPKALVLFDCLLEQVGGNSHRSHLPPIDGLHIVDYLLAYPFSPLRVCLSSEILMHHRFDEDISVGEDACLWMRIATAFPVIFIDHVGGRYITHDGNSVSPYSHGALLQYRYLRVFFRRYPAIRRSISNTVYNNSMSRISTNIATYFFYAGKRWQSIKWVINALYHKPIGEHTRYRCNIILANVGLRKAPFSH